MPSIVPRDVKHEKNDSDDEEDQLEEAKPVEVKRRTRAGKGQPRTPAQQEAFKKALATLKEKREAKAKEEKEKFEAASKEEQERIKREKYEKSKNHHKKLPPAPSYVTSAEFGASLERLKSDLLAAIPKHVSAPASFEAKEAKEAKAAKETNEPHEAKAKKEVIKKAPEPKPPKALSGHELLDKLFFS